VDGNVFGLLRALDGCGAGEWSVRRVPDHRWIGSRNLTR
jgi:hypothetical protein